MSIYDELLHVRVVDIENSKSGFLVNIPHGINNKWSSVTPFRPHEQLCTKFLIFFIVLLKPFVHNYFFKGTITIIYIYRHTVFNCWSQIGSQVRLFPIKWRNFNINGLR